MLRNLKLKDYDFKLIFLVLALSVMGVIAIASAEPSLRNKQMIGVIAGTFLMVVVSLIDYTKVLQLHWLIYAGNILLLLAVVFFGDDAKGAKRWLEIGGLTFQPSELAKILLILFFAQFIIVNKGRLNTFPVLASCLGLIALPCFLVYLQPDLSTTIVIVVLFCVIMFAGGISLKIVFTILAVTIPALAIIITLAMNPDNNILKDYQKDRVLAFINPEEYASAEAYQQLNSVMAIGSGMLDGKGYQNNEITSVKNGNFISETQTDFIFAIIGEEFGFKGCVAVIVLWLLLVFECVSVARKAKDDAGMLIAVGMGGLIAFQGFINIGVATFLLPNTGLPLPFVSYGLTSLLSLYIGMGFVINVRLQAKN